jgi:hypothetical protein
MKTPSIKSIADLLKGLKSEIEYDFRCSDDSDDDKPGMQVTVGCDLEGNWGWQTGDTQYTGGAYGYDHWGIAYLYRNSNCLELACCIIEELKESQAQKQ